MIVFFGCLYSMIKTFSTGSHGQASDRLSQKDYNKTHNCQGGALRGRKAKKSQPKFRCRRQQSRCIHQGVIDQKRLGSGDSRIIDGSSEKFE